MSTFFILSKASIPLRPRFVPLFFYFYLIHFSEPFLVFSCRPLSSFGPPFAWSNRHDSVFVNLFTYLSVYPIYCLGTYRKCNFENQPLYPHTSRLPHPPHCPSHSLDTSLCLSFCSTLSPPSFSSPILYTYLYTSIDIIYISHSL